MAADPIVLSAGSKPTSGKSLADRVKQLLGLAPNSNGWATQQQLGYQVTLNPIVQVGWMGPGQPLNPLAPANVAGRRFDYPVTYNLSYQPKVDEGISYAALRGFARYYDHLRIVLESCKDDIARLEWNIVPKDRDKKPGKDCAEIQTFLERPDRKRDWDQWCRVMLEDMMVIDAMTVQPQLTRGGDLYALKYLDGATIKPYLDFDGDTPEPYTNEKGEIQYPPAYAQIIKGVPAVDYWDDLPPGDPKPSLIWYPTNQASDRVYGYSIVEQVVMTINIALRRQAFMLQYYTDGSLPDLILAVPKEWVSDQIAEWKKGWDAQLRGNQAERRGTMFVPEGMKVVDTKDKALVDKNADEFFLRIICFAFGKSPQPFVSMMNRATGETAKEMSEETGTGSRMQRFASLMNRVLAHPLCFNRPDLRFKFKESDETDPSVKSEMNLNKVKAGAKTIDEWRYEDGEDPLPNGMGAQPLVYTASGAVLLDDILNPPEPTEATTDESQLTGHGGQPHAAQKRLRKRKWYDRPANPVAKANLTKSVKTALGMVRENVQRAVRTKATKADADSEDVDAVEIDLGPLGLLYAEFTSVLGDTAKAGADRAVREFQSDMFDLAQDNAAAWALDHAGELISDDGAEGILSESTRAMLRRTIADAFDQGLTADDLANQLSDDYAFSEERADLIAETELRTADSNGYLEGAKATGLELQKHWIAEPDCCDDCQENEDAGFIDLDDEFPSGDDAPQAHPHCRCALGIRGDQGDDTEED